MEMVKDSNEAINLPVIGRKQVPLGVLYLSNSEDPIIVILKWHVAIALIPMACIIINLKWE
jgi:hypothetical protein